MQQPPPLPTSSAVPAPNTAAPLLPPLSRTAQLWIVGGGLVFLGFVLLLLLAIGVVWSRGRSHSATGATPATSETPDLDEAIAYLKTVAPKDDGAKEAAISDCDVFPYGAPQEHRWRVNGKIDLCLGNSRTPTERPFQAELTYDGTWHKVWIAIGRQAIDAHNR